MELILNTFGAYFHKKDEMFEIKTDEKKLLLSPEKIDRILITNAVFLSSDAILLALQNNIDIIFLDKYGEPHGRIWYARPGSTITIKRKQLEFSCNKSGVRIALEWVRLKLDNQKKFLSELASTRDEIRGNYLKEKSDFIEKMMNDLSGIEGNIDEVRDKIMGIEGVCGKNYFEAISEIMPTQYLFNGRSHRPAKDYFNTFLNYGYGVLYSIIERAILIAGLDPYIGFIHADNYNKRSLVFDLIEPYRTIVDKTVVFLFTGKKVKKECCREIPNGYTLDKEGKELLISSLNERLDKTIHYNGKNCKIRDTIQLDCHKIAQNFLKN